MGVPRVSLLRPGKARTSINEPRIRAWLVGRGFISDCRKRPKKSAGSSPGPPPQPHCHPERTGPISLRSVILSGAAWGPTQVGQAEPKDLRLSFALSTHHEQGCPILNAHFAFRVGSLDLILSRCHPERSEGSAVVLRGLTSQGTRCPILPRFLRKGGKAQTSVDPSIVLPRHRTISAEFPSGQFSCQAPTHLQIPLSL